MTRVVVPPGVIRVHPTNPWKSVAKPEKLALTRTLSKNGLITDLHRSKTH